jgi:hypothetical protein
VVVVGPGGGMRIVPRRLVELVRDRRRLAHGRESSANPLQSGVFTGDDRSIACTVQTVAPACDMATLPP